MTPYYHDTTLTIYHGDCLSVLREIPTDTADMVITSPPYMDARTYGIDAQRDCDQWVEWMLPIVAELVRVTKGPVFVNCAGVTRDWQYWPGCEGLSYRAYKAGIIQRRPAYWHKVGIPGSGGVDYLRADIEYVLCFTKCKGRFPWSDNTANGHPPKWGPGGAMSHRTTSGRRVNQWGHSFESGGTGGPIDDVTCRPPRPSHRLTKAGDNGKPLREQAYLPPTLANPGNLISGIPVGGGLLGHPLAHENEAPYPVKFAEWFIRSWCPPDGVVLDPFGGSGTTAHAARNLKRRAILMDIRESQCDLMKRRLGLDDMFSLEGVA